MAPTKLSGAGKRRTVKNPSKNKLSWTFEMKETVYLLFGEFKDLATRIKEQVFLRIFQDQISSFGFPEAVPRRVLAAQYGIHKRGIDKDWQKICGTSFTKRAAASRVDRRAQIQEIARSLEAPQLAAQSQRDQPVVCTSVRRSARLSVSRVRGARPRASGTPTSNSLGHQNEAHVAPNGRRPQAPQTAHTMTPLSKRPAVAYWDPSSSDDEIEVRTPSSKRRKIPQEAQVVIPRIPNKGVCRKPSTPKSTPRRLRTDLIPFQRPDRSVIMLTKEEMAKVETNLVPPSEHAARPPTPPLLFRYWDEDPLCDRDSRNGFTARFYFESNVRPYRPPPVEDVDLVHIYNHLNRKMEKSPFISASSRLIWIIDQMLEGLKSGNSRRLSIIDTTRLDPRAVYWARSYHDKLVPSRGFTNGAHRYRGTYEWLIWNKIPQEAIVHTVQGREILQLVQRDNVLAETLQLEILRSKKSLSGHKIPQLKANAVPLTKETSLAISRLCRFFGLHAHLPEALTHIVSDVVEGWGLHVDRRGEAEWYQLATFFAREICRYSPQASTLAEQEKVKFAFLNGVGFGKGSVNCKFKPTLLEKKIKAASAVGLTSPAQIVANQLDAAKMAVLMAEKTENQRLNAYHRRRITFVPDGEADEEDDDDMLYELASGQIANGNEEMETNEDSDDEGIIFEAEDDGLVL